MQDLAGTTLCALERLLRQSPAALAAISLNRSVLRTIAAVIKEPASALNGMAGAADGAEDLGPDAIEEVASALRLVQVRTVEGYKPSIILSATMQLI